ncbi:hypothetical protein [uncultured Tenacibaculum sp.]|uniref:helix-turn-helix transcriptional regulator n=1 Tax=uncultured Tenacibaculum sp. TaxID=174713 RepID=UPI002607FBB7|nr:hypothetical protein [uncultured Tenacibaculum sp.]
MKSHLKRLQTLIEKRRKFLLILIISIHQQLIALNSYSLPPNTTNNLILIENFFSDNLNTSVSEIQIAPFHDKESNEANFYDNDKLIIIGFFLFFLTISYFVINRFRKVFLKKQKQLDVQKEFLQKKEKKLQQKIDLKNKLITSYAFNFQQKDEVINRVFSLARSFEKTSSQSEEKELIDELIIIGKENLQIDKEWEHFRLFFEENLAGFHSKLKSKHPELNPNDLKICSLIRLNLNIKEAANILSISPGSLKTARYRLRKKLNLESGQKIIDYILKIDREEFC